MSQRIDAVESRDDGACYIGNLLEPATEGLRLHRLPRAANQIFGHHSVEIIEAPDERHRLDDPLGVGV